MFRVFAVVYILYLLDSPSHHRCVRLFDAQVTHHHRRVAQAAAAAAAAERSSPTAEAEVVRRVT